MPTTFHKYIEFLRLNKLNKIFYKSLNNLKQHYAIILIILLVILMKNNVLDLIVIVSGPAGCASAIYSTRSGLKTAMITGSQIGGQLILTPNIDNYPGICSISGFDLMEKMHAQVKKLNTEIINANVLNVKRDKNVFSILLDNNSVLNTKSVIIATGATPKRLNIPGEKILFGKGVSYCATCDGFFFKNKHVAVIGGGNTAVEEAMFLSKIANTVTLMHRRDELKADKILQDELFKIDNINVMWDTSLIEIKGNDDNSKISSIIFGNNKTKEECEMAIDGLFIAIGYSPNSDIFKNLVMTDQDGYIVTQNYYTNTHGIFAAGDVQDRNYKQAIIAAGQGAAAAIEAQKWLKSRS